MTRKFNLHSVLYLVLGAMGAGLYRWVYQTAIDDMGIFVPFSTPEILLLVLTAAAVLAAALNARFPEMPAPTPFADTLGSIFFAAGIATLLLNQPKGPAPLVMAYRAIAAAAAVSLFLRAVLRLLGKKPHFLLTLFPCVFTFLHLVECYQLWSEVPTLMHYIFGLGAGVCLMLFCYHTMAASAGMYAKRVPCFSGLMGIFCCCVAAMQAEFPLFFGAAALWLVSQMLFTGPVPEAPAKAVESEPEAKTEE